MAFVLSDLTRDTTSTTGAGAVSLDNSALTLGQLLSDVLADGDTTLYCIRHRTLNEWETGLGTYAANTLARTTVFESSNADEAVNFSAGIKDVIIIAPALMSAMLDREQTFSEAQTFAAGASMDSQKITELATPTNPTDAATKQYVDDSVRVTSFNTRTGDVTLTSTDVTNALGDAEIAYVDVANTFTKTQTFQAPASGVAAVFKGDASDTENITEWRDSLGTALLAAITPAAGGKSGGLYIPNNGSAGGGNWLYNDTSIDSRGETYLTGYGLRFYFGSAANPLYSLNFQHVSFLEQMPQVDTLGTGGVLFSSGSVGIITRNGNDIGITPTFWESLTLSSGGTNMLKLDGVAGTLSANVVFFPVQAPTASAPTYVKGGMYYDTTLNKLRIGGATGWETVTST